MAATDNLTKCLLAREEHKAQNDRCLASDRQATYDSLIPGKKADTKEPYHCIVCQGRPKETTNNLKTRLRGKMRITDLLNTQQTLTITLPFMFM
jgi:hypothetical protein